MKKLIPFTPAAVILILLVAAAATTLDDFFLPGSQIGQSGNIETPDRCDNCHGGYDQAIEPAFNWRGSMMAQAARDPVFYACLAIANQDAPGVGDMCLRCHTPDGWLNGRCVPTDGSALNNNDRQGVQCDFCHKMVKPLQKDATGKFINPYPLNSAYNSTVYGSNTFVQDQSYVAQIIPVPGTSANGMYLADANNAKRGPFTNATGRHQMFYSPFHQDAAHCGTCHDVSNPVLTRANTSIPTYTPNAFGQMSETFDLRLMFPIERTYSEYQASGYNKPKSEGGKICQDCHMKDVTGKAASMKDAVLRTDMPLHDMTGGNTFAPKMIKQKWAAEVNAAALDAGITRAQAQLKAATTLELSVSGTTASVKIINNTGHKFPTGYPEGRRAWINLIAYDASNNIIFESGTYSSTLADIVDPNHSAKVYHCEPGISESLSATLKNLGMGDVPPGPSYHMALNDMIYFDNRIPPMGATNASLETAQSPSVGYSYPDGQNWDVTNYTLPATPARVEAKLYYQTASKSFVTFLRDENVTNSTGTELYALWEAHGKSTPELMNSATWGSGGGTVPNDVLAAKFNTAVTRTTSTKTGTSASVNVLVTLNGTGVSGATVVASYTGPTTGTLTVTTKTGGLVTLTSKSVKNATGSWCFTIASVTYNNISIKPLIKICEGETPKSAVIPELLAGNSLMVYPNPVSGTAKIAYTLAEESDVRIAVYNNLGQQMTLLVNKQLGEGAYEADWNGTPYPDGVYICRMTAGSQVISKTLILKK